MNSFVFISIEEVVLIHEKMIEIGGGSSGIRDIELLHSALERPKASFGGKYLYKSALEMGAAMLQSLVKNDLFIDGNKRTAFFATLRFLEKNNFNYSFENKDIVNFMVSVDTQNLSIHEIADWFEKRKI
jgi:death-on-curing protein